MNYRVIFNTIGKILLVESALLVFPLIVSFLYQEKHLYIPFTSTILILLIIGLLLLKYFKIGNKLFFAKEGFAIVSLSWILISLFGSLPFIFSKEIPNFYDAFFETVSGFTTTGSTILNDVEAMSYGLLFWRSFTHWIGGMGILVFVLALLPNIDPRSMYILKAESPGPQVGKIVSKIRLTAAILYIIYIILTFVLFILLWAGKMPLFDSIVHAFATAGTGGFSTKGTSIMAYNSSYIEIVITIFMLVFATNFNIFYLILIGQGKQVFKNEELRWYIGIVLLSITIITINTLSTFKSISTSLRFASFQVSSIISTTGFASYDFNTWPALSQWVLIILMVTGGCAGATCGGMKISRVAILFKTVFNEIKLALHPHQISTIKFEGKKVEGDILRGVTSFLVTYFFIIFIGTLVISFEEIDIVTSFTSVLSCMGNIGPGLSLVGPMANFSFFSDFSKVFLSILMLAGRLEIFPILILFTPGMWKKI